MNNITNKLIWVFIFIGAIVFMSFIRDTRKNKRVIFFGDSITEQGAKPGGYISLMKDMLAQQGINNYDLIGAGIGGNKVYDLYLRMQEDVIQQSPDIVVIWVGVNDVWHKSMFGTGTDADKFEKIYRAIIKELQSNNIKVVLITPTTIGEKSDYTNPQDGDLNKYAQIIRNIAKDLNLPLVDLHAIFHTYEVNNNTANADKGILTVDGVHLNDAGNKLTATEIWKVLKDVQ